jgi:DNA-binding NarL/FixJ family response regulator
VEDPPQLEHRPTALRGLARAADTRGVTSSRHHPVAPVRVLIVDQDPLVRRVVRDALREDGITVVAEAGDGLTAVHLAAEHHPDVVLTDVVLPELDGPTTIRRIVSASPVVRVVVFTAAKDPDTGVTALKAGASGYITKDTDPSTLRRIIRAVAGGEAAVSRAFVSVLIDRLRAAPEGNAGLRPVRSPLTPREWEVLDLLSAGLSLEEVTETLVLSSETVRSHLQRAMRKLGVNSRGAAIEAVRELRASAASVAVDGPWGVVA